MKKLCPVCEDEIYKKSKQWSKQIYCSTKCRKVAHRRSKARKTREQQKRSNMLQNEEVLYLVRQCRRAGTVEILSGHTSDSFIETMKLIRNKPKADVHICHIAPVKGETSIGLFHCQNLFYGGSFQNRSLGNRQLGKEGLAIEKSKLSPKWAIAENHSTNDVLVKIEEYLGRILDEYIKNSPIRKSKRAQLAHKITKLSTKESIDKLLELSHRELLDKWLATSKAFIPRTTSTARESKYIVYVDELSRFISYNREDRAQLKSLKRTMIIGYRALERIDCSSTYNSEFKDKYKKTYKKYKNAHLEKASQWSKLKDLIYETAFRALQGETSSMKRKCRKIMNYIVFHESNALE